MKRHLKTIFGAAVTGSLLVLAGCVLTSVYPYYTAKDVVFEPKLLGRWADRDKPEATNEFWEFTRTDTNAAYTLTVHEGDKETPLQAHLFRLQQWTFLDAVPTEEHEDFVPPHYLLKVTQVEPTLKMVLLDYKWVSELLEKQPGALQHLYVEAKPGEQGRLVLTAQTPELQKFVRKYGDNTNAFSSGIVLERKR